MLLDGGGGGGGGPPPPTIPPAIADNPAPTARSAPEATARAANIVFPMSPDTTRLAMKGMKATISDSKILDSEISNIWLAP